VAKKLTSRIEKQNYGGLACRRSAALLIFALFSHTLGAYNIGPVPIAWLSTVFFIISPIPIIFSRKFHIPPSLNNIIIYLVCGIISLFIYDILYSPPPMPPLASTSYAVYLILRIATVISYIAALFTSYNLVLNGMSYLILRSNVYLLGIVTVLGIYIYLAQRYGFWEPPRTRMGTGGQDFTLERVEFQYLFHRALGTFREPSHLANWLSATLLFLLPQKDIFRKERNKFLLLIFSIFLLILSGSLLGIICLLAGFVALMAVGGRRSWLLAVFSLIVIPAIIWFANAFFNVDIISAISPRLQTILQNGLIGTNRSYVYEYFLSYPPSALGIGIGHNSLAYSMVSGNLLVSPVINAFVNILYEAGIIGLVLVVSSFLFVFTQIRPALKAENLVAIGALAAHVSWIFAYFGMVPELSPYHATIIGIFFGQLSLVTSKEKKYNNIQWQNY
jgi:hypothetical protein